MSESSIVLTLLIINWTKWVTKPWIQRGENFHETVYLKEVLVRATSNVIEEIAIVDSAVTMGKTVSLYYSATPFGWWKSTVLSIPRRIWYTFKTKCKRFSLKKCLLKWKKEKKDVPDSFIKRMVAKWDDMKSAKIQPGYITTKAKATYFWIGFYWMKIRREIFT